MRGTPTISKSVEDTPRLWPASQGAEQQKGRRTISIDSYLTERLRACRDQMKSASEPGTIR
jgi:hypothetical protein